MFCHLNSHYIELVQWWGEFPQWLGLGSLKFKGKTFLGRNFLFAALAPLLCDVLQKPQSKTSACSKWRSKKKKISIVTFLNINVISLWESSGNEKQADKHVGKDKIFQIAGASTPSSHRRKEFFLTQHKNSRRSNKMKIILVC